MHWQTDHKPILWVIGTGVVVNVLQKAAERIEVDSVEDGVVTHQVRWLAEGAVAATGAHSCEFSEVPVVLFELFLDIVERYNQYLVI